MKSSKKVGVVLTGGGARGAYQAGVLKGVCEITDQMGMSCPFSIFSGISVGAINSALLASYSENMNIATAKLVEIWENLRTNKVIHTGAVELGKTASRLIFELTSGKMVKEKRVRSLLDNSPLSKLISDEIDFSKIHKNIREGYLESLAITAVNYADGKNYIFFESNQDIEPWVRERRVVMEASITHDHVLASAALPIYFPPHKIGGQYFADGNIRNSTPLSPPIRLGAEKLLVIPVTEEEALSSDKQHLFEPTLGRILTIILNAVLLDAIDFDFERLARINDTLSLLPPGADTPLKPIDVLIVRPSESVGDIAYHHADDMPKALRYFVEGLGSPQEAGGLISTLLFEPPFTKKLLKLGYEDAMRQKDKVAAFFSR